MLISTEEMRMGSEEMGISSVEMVRDGKEVGLSIGMSLQTCTQVVARLTVLADLIVETLGFVEHSDEREFFGCPLSKRVSYRCPVAALEDVTYRRRKLDRLADRHEGRRRSQKLRRSLSGC